MEIDAVLREHANKMDRMIQDGTYAGYHSALGFLYYFASDLLAAHKESNVQEQG